MLAVQSDPPVRLCVDIASSKPSSKRGATTQWVVTAWATGGNISDAIIRLEATPSSAAPKFSFGCGSSDGTASCDLGAMDATSVQRQLQADSKVPATATSVKSVKMTVIGSAAKLPKDPTASATVQISGTVTTSTTTTTNPTLPSTTTSPLPVGSLPDVPPATTPTLSPGGNAAKLFPTLQPSPSSSTSKNVKGRPVADTAALPEGASVVGASLIGLAALALAFVLAVTRFSIRRRPAPTTPAATATAAAAPPETDKPATGAAAAAAATDAAATETDQKPAGATLEPVKDAPGASAEAAEGPGEAPKASGDAPEAAPDAAPEAPEDPANPTAENNQATSNSAENNQAENNPGDSSADGSTPDP